MKFLTSKYANSRYLFIAKIALPVISVGAIAVIVFSWEWNLGLDRIRLRAEYQSGLIGSDVFAPTEKYTYLPSLVANYEVIANALSHPADVTLIRQANALLKQVNNEAGTVSIFVMDKYGFTIASSNAGEQDSFVGKNFGYRPYFLEGWRKGRGSFYGVGAVTGAPGLFISGRVAKNGNALGIVVVKADIRRFRTGWNNLGSEMLMEDENGIVFLSSRDEWMYRPISALDEKVISQLRSTRQYSNILREPLRILNLSKANSKAAERIVFISQNKANSQDTEFVSYFVKSVELPDSPWKIHLLIPLADIWMDSLKVSMIVVGGIFVFVLLALYYRQQRIRQRERKEAWLEMEESHKALERKNRDLISLSEQLRVQSITDPLTGSFNRRFFVESSSKMISLAQRHHQALSIVMIDVDHFKNINDVYGHPAGDEVLKMIAAIYRGELREDDIFARYGGEEFIMALAHTNEREAEIVAERLRKKVMDTVIELEGEMVQITVSTGITQLYVQDKDITALIKRADEALYEAKESGRNCVVINVVASNAKSDAFE